MAQVKDLGSMSFMLGCTRKVAGLNAWSASSSVESSCGPLLQMEMRDWTSPACDSNFWQYLSLGWPAPQIALIHKFLTMAH